MPVSVMYHPDLALNVIPWMDPNLVVTSDPIPGLIVTRHPDTFSSSRNPLPVNFPMA